MLTLAEATQEAPYPLGPKYQSLGAGAPFHLSVGSYKDASVTATGFPNLDDPSNSTFGVDLTYTYWVGQQPLASVPGDPLQTKSELDSTLVGGACKLMTAGGLQPTLPSGTFVTGGDAMRNTLGASATGVPDTALGYQRLGELLLYTYTKAHLNPATREDFIDTLALNANLLAIGNWGVPFIDMDERVRESFAEYGFGRSTEFEPNSPQNINDSILANFPKNLIAAGKRYSRPIEGELDDCDDEDFFVLNERITIGDKITFDVQVTQPGALAEVRFYQADSCDFDSEQCSTQRQEYPIPAPDGSTVYGGDPPQPVANGTFTWQSLSSGGVGGGGSTYRTVFVGIKLFPGTGCSASYKLEVQLLRTSATQDPYP
jgi:hypothetical protein